MSNPSPKAHLVRLAAVLVGVLVVFLIIKQMVVPDSWNYEEWYREGALALNASEPLAYGGNESCAACHQETNDELAEFKHKALSCESCHGALADHVTDGVKTAAAQVDDESTWQCLNCHEARVSKPEGFPQFDKVAIKEHTEIEEGMLCLACHTPHDPTP
ncbi:MAG: hypothetical protein HQ504_00520 [Rhodospirillaceae bacterium]|nr:hypothetical protein [Rhodospirillaceae bacterium]